MALESSGYCNAPGCECEEYIISTSKWSKAPWNKGKCKKCDHTKTQHTRTIEIDADPIKTCIPLQLPSYSPKQIGLIQSASTIFEEDDLKVSEKCPECGNSLRALYIMGTQFQMKQCTQCDYVCCGACGEQLSHKTGLAKHFQPPNKCKMLQDDEDTQNSTDNDWICEICFFGNAGDKTECQMCLDPRNDNAKQSDSDPSNGLLYIKTLTGKIISVVFKATDTIQHVKQTVEDQEGIPPQQQRLIFAGKMLDDDRTLDKYNIQAGCTVHLILRLRDGPEDDMEAEAYNKQAIFIRFLDGTSLELDDFDSLNIIRDIKYLIEHKKKIAINRQYLIFGGNGLENDKTLKEYNIVPGCTLHFVDLESCDDDLLILFIRKSTGGTLSMNTKQSALVKSLKQAIENESDIPIKRQQLIFAGTQFENETALSEYNLTNQCVVRLVIEDSQEEGAIEAVDMQQNDDNNANDEGDEGTLEIIMQMIQVQNNEDEDDLLSSSGLGRLMKILSSHLKHMKENEQFVDQILENEDDILRIAKEKSVEAETAILLSIMMDVISMSDFIKNIILIENLFSKLYSNKLKNEQENARNKYASNIIKYENVKQKAQNENVDSFQSLIFAGQFVHIGDFKKWLNDIEQKCRKQNIVIKINSGAHVKQIERAFYKAFYCYKSDNNEGYKQMTDVLRTSLVFDSFGDLYRAFGVIDENINILRVKDRFQPKHVPFGYRDILINFYCPGSKIVCELQLQHLLFYQHKKASHDIYKKARLFERDGQNYAYEYAQKFAKPKLGDEYDIYSYSETSHQSHGMKQNEESKDDNDVELEMNAKELLKHWGLRMYANKMVDEEGWDNPSDWIDLDEDDLKNDIGFKKAHCKKFQRKYKKWIQKKMDSEEYGQRA
eukprot:136362_1